MRLYPNVNIHKEKYLEIPFFVERCEYYEEFIYYNMTSDSEIFRKRGAKTVFFIKAVEFNVVVYRQKETIREIESSRHKMFTFSVAI